MVKKRQSTSIGRRLCRMKLNLKFNLNGQISLIFSFAWVFLSYFAIKFDDMLKNDLCRKTMFNNKIN